MAGETDRTDQILGELRSGDGSTDALLVRLYDELRKIADRLMGDERIHHTLQPTALVHEAFLRLVDTDSTAPKDRGEYLALAAVAMRHILIDHSRGRMAEKRGGGWKRVTLLGFGEGPESDDGVDLLQLDAALDKLKELDARQAKIVELRFFSGMSGQEIADHLGVSRNTVVRELTVSRAWLQRELQRGS